MKPAKTIMIVLCFVTAILCCSTCFAQCEGGVCALPGRVVVRTSQRTREVVLQGDRPIRSASRRAATRVNQAVKEVASRTFRRGLLNRRNDRG